MPKDHGSSTPRPPFVDTAANWKRAALDRLRIRVVPREPRIALRITAGFVLLGLLAGMIYGPSGAFRMLLICGSVVLVQEFPRALVAHALGIGSKVELSAVGGHIELLGVAPRGLWAFVYRSAGSIANLLVAAGALTHAYARGGLETASVARDVALCHGVWGLAQLVPLLPFHVGQALAARLRPQARFAHAAASLGAAFAAMPLAIEGRTAAFLVLALAVMGSLDGLASAFKESSDLRSNVAAHTAKVEALLQRGDGTRASALALEALAVVRGERLRNRLHKAHAWAAIEQGDSQAAQRALEHLEPGEIDFHLLAAYLGTQQRYQEALELLEAARALGSRNEETSKLHIDLLFRANRESEALAILDEDTALLTPIDRQTVRKAIERQS